MRIGSDGETPRFDLEVLRRYVPALWAEWGALRFDPDGLLVDPDTGESLDVLRLTSGVHRAAQAHYRVLVGAVPYTFELAEDDGHTVRGTLTGPAGTARLAVGGQVSVSGHGVVPAGRADPPSGGPSSDLNWTIDLRIGDRWRADGHAEVSGQNWSGELTSGERWHVSARIDVRALLLANDVPAYVVTLIGGREAILELDIDPTVLAHHGDVVTGQATVQRARADGVIGVRAKSTVWIWRITLHLHGRGLIGRSALLAARPAVRRAVSEGIAEFWNDLASQAPAASAFFGELERDADEPGGAAGRVHRELWPALRDADRDNRTAAAASAKDGHHADRVIAPRRVHRALLPFAVLGLIALVVALVVVIIVAGTSSHTSSPDPDLTSTPPLHIRQRMVAAFAGTDLQQRCATSVVTGSTRLLPDAATDDLTGRDASTIWETATVATAPGGRTYRVFILAVALKADPQQPDAPPAFARSKALVPTAGLGAGWRGTTELGPLDGPPWYPSATTLTRHTLLVVRLEVVTGAAAELRRLTSQLSLPIRQRYLTATRP